MLAPQRLLLLLCDHLSNFCERHGHLRIKLRACFVCTRVCLCVLVCVCVCVCTRHVSHVPLNFRVHAPWIGACSSPHASLRGVCVCHPQAPSKQLHCALAPSRTVRPARLRLTARALFRVCRCLTLLDSPSALCARCTCMPIPERSLPWDHQRVCDNCTATCTSRSRVLCARVFVCEPSSDVP
jgi:hypothetical protein